MKSKKHRFVHPDPEKVELDSKTAPARAKKAKPALMDEARAAQNDLKNSLATIGIFALILIGFYFLDKQYDFFVMIKDIL